jgi:hypothetical protein
MVKRKVRLTPINISTGNVKWQIEEYEGWFFGWKILGTTASLELAKNIIKTMEETGSYSDQRTTSV